MAMAEQPARAGNVPTAHPGQHALPGDAPALRDHTP
jgi:hypothetical protein